MIDMIVRDCMIVRACVCVRACVRTSITSRWDRDQVNKRIALRQVKDMRTVLWLTCLIDTYDTTEEYCKHHVMKRVFIIRSRYGPFEHERNISILKLELVYTKGKQFFQKGSSHPPLTLSPSPHSLSLSFLLSFTPSLSFKYPLSLAGFLLLICFLPTQSLQWTRRRCVFD